ncbi:Sporulation specific protein [Komagataella phaffii CBS 7435]|uniref:Sporulation specific protein that localizes to the spore wall n=2 Tax=Komagataella phaffii TaxID=460519 RepID=C4R6H1_KOMPG|nr:Sporulation specific protein that localizes to the spore wall [Komagataella phaffii GS115]AOA63818.1 GQ67_04229T0 [Komagataella phaffii]CAH2448999.1 Sporulation specific protein [Komagataella phaffii CBS 7435]AOA68638.1 GQ68_04201T0 [Komagataella phaffii GS115]CAY71157.1 Sporulation specific protein that localizes to the spore wall [Komagataella phaffii GS115]CCA39043.1 Sporulation specific protein [Komagataella phaffii CBS 7435]
MFKPTYFAHFQGSNSLCGPEVGKITESLETPGKVISINRRVSSMNTAFHGHKTDKSFKKLARTFSLWNDQDSESCEQDSSIRKNKIRSKLLNSANRMSGRFTNSLKLHDRKSPLPGDLQLSMLRDRPFSKSGYLTANHYVSNQPSMQDDSLTSENRTISSVGNRVIRLSELPPMASLNSILTQAMGGPLERVYLTHPSIPHPITEEDVTNSNISWNHLTVQLFFASPENAHKFLNYGCTGMFTINGVHPQLQWASRVLQETTLLPIIKDHIASNSARRILIFKNKTVQTKNKSSSLIKGYPSPTINYSFDFDIRKIKENLSKYGNIIGIDPVISQKLCFCVHFYDIRSAIIVKHEIDRADSELSVEYEDWNVWYAKDPTDTPYPEL